MLVSENAVVAIDDEGRRAEAAREVSCDLGKRDEVDRRDDPAADMAVADERRRHIGVEPPLADHEFAPLQAFDLPDLLQPVADFRRGHGLLRENLHLADAVFVVPGADHAPEIHVAVVDQHPRGVGHGGERPGQGRRHRTCVIDLEAAVLVEPGDAGGGVFRAAHMRAQRIVHRPDQQVRALPDKVEGIAVVGGDRQRQHAADGNQHQRAEAQRQYGRHRNPAPPGVRSPQSYDLARFLHASNVGQATGKYKPPG